MVILAKDNFENELEDAHITQYQIDNDIDDGESQKKYQRN